MGSRNDVISLQPKISVNYFALFGEHRSLTSETKVKQVYARSVYFTTWRNITTFRCCGNKFLYKPVQNRFWRRRVTSRYQKAITFCVYKHEKISVIHQIDLSSLHHRAHPITMSCFIVGHLNGAFNPKTELEKYNPNLYGIKSRPEVSGGFN